jgi:hypothetical protein
LYRNDSIYFNRVNNHQYMKFKPQITLFNKSEVYQNRYIKPIKNIIPAKKVLYENALEFVDSIKNEDISIDSRIYAIVSGNFIFGDFIEAFIDAKNFNIKELTITTLSMSENNVDSLENLLHKWKYVKKLNLIISDYFYSHERNLLIPYIYKKLDIENKFQLAICRTHMKICQFETIGQNKCVINGSANLRSSQCLEQITIEENKDLYDFNQKYFNIILEKYKSINKYSDLYNLLKTN